MEGVNKDYPFLMGRKAIDEKAANIENGKILWEKTEQILKSHQIMR